MRPARPTVSAIYAMQETMLPLTTVVTLSAPNISLPVVGNFISAARPVPQRIAIMFGRHINQVVDSIHMRIGLFHEEKIDLLVLEGDEWKTAFNAPNSHYEYWVMPYRLADAPSVSRFYE